MPTNLHTMAYQLQPCRIIDSISEAGDGYRLSYNEFLGGSIGDSLKKAKGVKFSTFDNDQDGSQLYSCARLHRVGVVDSIKHLGITCRCQIHLVFSRSSYICIYL